MIIAAIGSYHWAMASMEDAEAFLKIMSRAVPAEYDTNVRERYRQKGGNDYILDIEITLRAGELPSYEEAMKAAEKIKKQEAA